MKRLILTILAVLLWATPALAQNPMMKAQPVKYRGTITGLLISGVDGTAFIDASNASVTALADGNHSIEIYDSSGRFIRGVLSAAGAGETLGSELATNGDMETGDPPTGWSASGSPDLSVLDGVADERTGGAGAQSLSATFGSYYSKADKTALVAYKLYYFSFWGKKINSNFGLRVGTSEGATFSDIAWANHVGYRTAITTTISCTSAAVNNVEHARYDDISVKQVLTPSATGATIVSTKGGATQSWAYKNASFTYNAASYYVVIRELRGRTLNLSTTGTSPRISAVDDTAFVDNLPAGITAYADGLHYLRIYDPAGKYVEGVLSAVGSGETLGAELIDAWTNNAGAYPWETLTLSGINITSGINSSGLGYASSGPLGAITGKLLKAVCDLTVTSGSARFHTSINITGGSPDACSKEIDSGSLSSTQMYTKYGTVCSSQARYVNFSTSSDTANVSAVTSLKQVLTSSATGATIVNSISGATYRWITKETGFDYNSSGTYTFQVWSQY